MRRYLRKLSKSLKDDENVATEMILLWIATTLTLLTVVAIVDVLTK